VSGWKLLGVVVGILLVALVVAGVGLSSGTKTVTETVTKTTTETSTSYVTKTLTKSFTVTVTSGTKVELLEDGDYFARARSLISRANSTILVMMYAMKYDPKEVGDPVNQLLLGLVEAKGRGVEVRVLVDDVTAKSYPQSLSYLKEHGVPVRLDESPKVTTHVKLVLIDGNYSLIGSHNWTESALKYNHELSVLIESGSVYEALEGYFNGIWEEGRTVKI